MPLRVKCPRCGESTAYQGNPWRPFCSERCKLIDLGRWAEEKYAISTDETPPEEGE
ncbi:MAG: DNA gyrase inhibitor YacG [bacterium]